MKFLFSILALLLTVKECDQKKTVVNETNSEIVSDQKTEMQQQEDYTIVYTASTRGYFKEVKISRSTLSVINSRGGEAVSTECSPELWDDIMESLKNIDIQSISELKAPTEYRFHDGAAFAFLKIIIDKDTSYSTSQFDHEFPPEEIKELCEKILSNSKIN